VLFFGLAGGAAMFGEFITDPAPRLERGRVTLPDGATHSALILPYRRHPALLRMIGGIGVVAGGAVFALAPRSGETGAFDNIGLRGLVGLAAAYFAVATALRVRSGIGSRDEIALTGPGMLVTAAGTSRFVPWTAVDSIERNDLRGNPMLAVRAKSPDAIVRSGGAGIIDAIGAAFYGRDQIPIGLRSLALPPDEILDLLRRFMEHGQQAGSHETWFDSLEEVAGAS
jgi:hypothetical protein